MGGVRVVKGGRERDRLIYTPHALLLLLLEGRSRVLPPRPLISWAKVASRSLRRSSRCRIR